MQAVLQELIYESMRDGAVWPFDRRYIRPRHFHGQLECLLVFRGSATLQLGSRASTVRAGQLCWILPGVPHVMGDFSPDFDMWVVELDAGLVDECWSGLAAEAPPENRHGPFSGWSVPLGERLAGRPIVNIGGDVVRRLDELARDVWTAARSADARAGLVAFGLLALEATIADAERRRPISVAELASCLLLADPAMDRPTAAAALCVSEGFLSRTVHKELGVTFVEHRARTRVAHFLALAHREKGNFLEAALAAGFGSYSQFHRTFSRLSGSRPRDYLERGRRRAQLLVVDDQARPHSGAVAMLPDRSRQRAPL